MHAFSFHAHHLPTTFNVINETFNLKEKETARLCHSLTQLGRDDEHDGVDCCISKEDNDALENMQSIQRRKCQSWTN